MFKHVLNGKLSLLSVVMCWWLKREYKEGKKFSHSSDPQPTPPTRLTWGTWKIPTTGPHPDQLTLEGGAEAPGFVDVPQGELTAIRTLWFGELTIMSHTQHSHLAAEVGIIVPLHR